MISLRILICYALCMLVSCSGTSLDSQADPKDAESIQPLNGPLRVLVVDDPEYAAVLKREWSARSEHDVEFRTESETEFLTQLHSNEKALKTDVVIFPSRQFGALAENRYLRGLPPELTSTSSEAAVAGYNLSDVFPAIARKEMKWERRQLAITLGSPTLLLLVRTDLVPSIPNTWAEFHQTVRQLRAELPEGTLPLVQPLGDGWAARTFMSRSAAYLYQPNRFSSFFEYTNLKPRIEMEPCVRALREMVADYDEQAGLLDPVTTLDFFLSGRAAMAITWPQKTTGENTETSPGPISVVELPATENEYDQRTRTWKKLAEPRRVAVVGHDGRMAAISRSAKNLNLAGVFLGWAGSAEQAKLFCPRSKSSAPFRRSNISDSGKWCDARFSRSAVAQYAASVESALSRPELFLALRLPGQDEYMAALNECILRALKKEISPEEALKQTSNQWETITDQHGRDKQIAAYAHSLGIDVE